MSITAEKADLIYNAIVDIAKSHTNLLPGGLGNANPSMPDLKKLAIDLCDAFEVVSSRESSSIQVQQ